MEEHTELDRMNKALQEQCDENNDQASENLEEKTAQKVIFEIV